MYRRLVAAHEAHPPHFKDISYGSPSGHTLDIYPPASVLRTGNDRVKKEDVRDTNGTRENVRKDDVRDTNGARETDGHANVDMDFGPSSISHDNCEDVTSSVLIPPVAIFVHGGAWEHGSKNLYATVGETLASRGFVAVIVDHTKYTDGHRLGKEFGDVEDATTDIIRCVQWVATAQRPDLGFTGTSFVAVSLFDTYAVCS